MSNTLESFNEKMQFRLNTGLFEYSRMQDYEDRRMFLYGEIAALDECEEGCAASVVSYMVERIIEINREDVGKPIEDRKPIRIYINSPGGNVTEGFALVDAIEISQTPIYTVNVGQWSSMAFLIGISGHKRFSLPHASFLMHDGSTYAFGSTSKAQDKMDFEKRFEQEVVKAHVLRHSNMKSREYDALSRVEFYLLPQDAKEHGFIDEIVTDIEHIF